MKKDHTVLITANKELRYLDAAAVHLIANWFSRYKNKTSLDSLAKILMSWDILAQTEEERVEIKKAEYLTVSLSSLAVLGKNG